MEDLTSRFSSSIGRKVRPVDAVVQVASAIELDGHGTGHNAPNTVCGTKGPCSTSALPASRFAPAMAKNTILDMWTLKQKQCGCSILAGGWFTLCALVWGSKQVCLHIRCDIPFNLHTAMQVAHFVPWSLDVSGLQSFPPSYGQSKPPGASSRRGIRVARQTSTLLLEILSSIREAFVAFSLFQVSVHCA